MAFPRPPGARRPGRHRRSVRGWTGSHFIPAGLCWPYSPWALRPSFVSVTPCCSLLLPPLHLHSSTPSNCAGSTASPNAAELKTESPAADVSSCQIFAQVMVISEPSITPAKRGASCLVRLQSLTIGQQHFTTQHHVRLRIDQLPRSLRDLTYGDTLQISGQLHRLPSARNPGSFSPADFYRRF